MASKPPVSGGAPSGMPSGGTFVKEAKRIIELLDPKVFRKDANIPAQLTKWLEKYQDQCELLDPHLEDIVGRLMKLINATVKAAGAGIGDESKGKSESKGQPSPADDAEAAVMHRAWQVVYIVCKVRGYKTVTGFFPHKVEDLEPALNALLQQDPRSYATWQTRYGLLLWLSLIVLIPFDLKTVDSQSSSGGGIIARLVGVGKQYLSDPGPSREAAAFFLAKLFSRTDIQREKHLPRYVEWAVKRLEDEKSSVFLVTGLFKSLATLMRTVQRSALQECIPAMIDAAVRSERWMDSRSGLLRKLCVKLSQRIGLAMLPQKVAPWRYQRGHRVLLENLQSAKENSAPGNGSTNAPAAKPAAAMGGAGAGVGGATDDGDDEDDVPDVIEEVIELLLTGLRDKDTIVRWSSAKGIGRVTMRLPAEFANDVLQFVLDLFSAGEGDGAWHGGCLALAELARRGLILPKALPKVIPNVIKALNYDVRQGSHSVGAHVRDAACYVAWAFARAYAPSVMAPYVLSLAQGLLTLAVFDREVNVRRAAAAAFQENVGRQGNFPHGIAINTRADYFTLGNRHRAYCSVCPFIAGFKDYRFHLIDHLVSVKLKHWSKEIRALAAESLGELCAVAPDHIAKSVLPELARRVGAADMLDRHGSCLGLARVLIGLSNDGDGGDAKSATARPKLDAGAATAVIDVVPSMEGSRFLLGKSGILMREALCELVRAAAVTRLLPRGDTKEGAAILTKYVAMLRDNLAQEASSVQDAAVGALEALAGAYAGEAKTLFGDLATDCVDTLGAGEDASADHKRRGCALALGALPKTVLREDLASVIHALSLASKAECEPDPDVRRCAVRSMQRASQTVGDAILEPISSFNRKKLLSRVVVDALLYCLADYSRDRRGDVGSWVREEAIRALERVSYQLVALTAEAQASDEAKGDAKASDGESGAAASPDGYWDAKMAQSVVCGLLKQMMEKIARTRQVAGEAFERMVAGRILAVPNLPLVGALRETVGAGVKLQEKAESVIDWEKNAAAYKQAGDDADNAADDTAAQTDAKGDPYAQPSEVDWSREKVTFPLLVGLFDAGAEIRRALVSGIVLSIGSRTEHLMRASSAALVKYLKSQDTVKLGCVTAESKEKRVQAVGEDLLAILERHRYEKRVTQMTLKTLALLLSRECFACLSGDAKVDLGVRIHKAVEKETSKSEDMNHIFAGMRVHLGLLSFPKRAMSRALKSCIDLLGHRFPKVRAITSEELYSQLLVDEEVADEDTMDEALELLSETTWNAELDGIYDNLDSINELFGYGKAVRVETKKESATEKKISYLDLVKEMGY